MYLGLNELSLHGQLTDRDAPALIGMLLQCRKAAADAGGALRCRREVLERFVYGATTLRDVAFKLPPQDNRRRLLMGWLTREGPFLEADRQHHAGVWFECSGEVVTDWTLAELAHRAADAPNAPIAAVSVRPSSMASNPLTVERVDDDEKRTRITLRNHGHNDDAALRAWLATCEAPMRSWQELADRARRTCPAVFFAKDAFAPLAPQPFHPGVADRLLERLRVLEALKCSFDASGALSPRGMELRQLHFSGDKAWFSDSSDGEKHEFGQDLTFPHPEQPGARLFCPWHGKVKTPQMRIHYTDPVTAHEPLYVVYVGPKITKR